MNLMLKRMFRVASSAFLSIALVISMLLSAVDRSNAAVKGWAPPEEKSSSLEENEGSDQEKSADDISMYELFGDEQVFPFEPGLQVIVGRE